MKRSYEEKVAALRERFLQSADKRVATMTQLKREAMEGNSSALSDLHMSLHDMGGNAMMLSFEIIGLTARKGQELVSNVEQHGQVADLANLTEILGELSEAIFQTSHKLDVDDAVAGSGSIARPRTDDR